MIPRCAQVILVEVQCGCVIVQGNDSVLNRSGKWLWEWYRKHQPVGVEVKVEIKTDQTNQPIESTIDQLIKLPTNQICARLPGRPNKRLLGEAEDNWEWLSKRANRQNNLYKRKTENHQPTEWPRSRNSSESNWIVIKRATHLRGVGSRSANRTIDQMIGQTWAQVQAPPLRSELVRVLDQGLKVWNRPGAWSRPQSLMFRRLM